MASSAIMKATFGGRRRLPAQRSRQAASAAAASFGAGLHLLAAVLCPHLGHARWERTGSPQFGQVPRSAPSPSVGPPLVAFWRLLLLRDTHLTFLLFDWMPFRGRPARVHDGAVAAALAFVEILCRSWAETGTILAAERQEGM